MIYLDSDGNARMTPPPHIDGARVLEWAWSDTPFGVLRAAGGGEAVAIHGLALCRYDGAGGVYRFSCNARWACEQDAVYASLAEAKQDVPAQYRRVEPAWQRAG
jgi:hypothetical protein